MREKGFSILEVILAAAFFIIFATASVVAVLQSMNANRLGVEMSITNQFASEGIEDVEVAAFYAEFANIDKSEITFKKM